MERTACCSCGQLSVSVIGEPQIVSACHCTDCQTRTGSAFGISAFFADSQVIANTGESKEYLTTSDAKRSLKRHFCPNCGTTVFWRAEMLPNMLGIAAGCFLDKDFPEPTVSVWNQSKLEWFAIPEHWKSFQKQPL
jgi:hypothetical protein